MMQGVWQTRRDSKIGSEGSQWGRAFEIQSTMPKHNEPSKPNIMPMSEHAPAGVKPSPVFPTCRKLRVELLTTMHVY